MCKCVCVGGGGGADKRLGKDGNIISEILVAVFEGGHIMIDII